MKYVSTFAARWKLSAYISFYVLSLRKPNFLHLGTFLMMSWPMEIANKVDRFDHTGYSIEIDPWFVQSMDLDFRFTHLCTSNTKQAKDNRLSHFG